MLRALAKNCLRSRADLVFVRAPRGFGKSGFIAAVQELDAAVIVIDLAGLDSERTVNQAFIAHLIEAEPTGKAMARRPRTVLFRNPEALFRAGLAHVLVHWIDALPSGSRAVVVSRIIPEALAASLSNRSIDTLCAVDFAFRPDVPHLERIGFTHGRIRELSSEFGIWPAAWQAIIRAKESGADDFSPSARIELADMVDTTFEELGDSRDTLLALAVLGQASIEEISAVVKTDDARSVLDQLDGYVTRTEDGRYALPSFFRTRVFSRYPSETATFVFAAISHAAGQDPLRALVIALERHDTAAARSILDGLAESERERLMAAASGVMGAESFLQDDDLFLTWWRLPRSRYQSVYILERLLALPESPVPAVRARRALAIAIFGIQADRLASITHTVAEMIEHPDLSPRLRGLARAKLAWLHAWEGDGDAFERLAPTLDPEHPDSSFAFERYAFICAIGSPDERRRILDDRLSKAAGNPEFERSTLAYMMIDGFCFDDDEQYQYGLARLREFAANDLLLARTLAYIDGEHPYLDFAARPHFRACAILVRAASEKDTAARLMLLRSAMAHADESLEVEIRLATRIAFAYAAPREADKVLSEAAGLARRYRSEVHAEAIMCAERLIAGGCLPGVARRFIAEDSNRHRLRLALLEGTIAGPSGQPIQVAARQFELIAFLALHEDASADREAIIEAIWPDLEPTAASHALKTAVHRLRTVLDDPSAIVLTARGYRLTDSIENDVERMGTLLATVDADDITARLGGLAMAYRQFSVALEQVRDGISRWSWADRYLPRLDSMLRRLAVLIAAHANRSGRFEFAHRIVGDLRTLDEADETAFEIAIESYLAAGNQISARREYDRYVKVLKGFGGSPSLAVSGLFSSVPRSLSS